MLRTIGMMLVILLVFTSVAMAHCGRCGIGTEKHEHSEEATLDEAGVINDRCPVMGGEVDDDAPYTVTYEGKKIGLCCPGCVSAFDKNPEKYYKKALKNREVRDENNN